LQGVVEVRVHLPSVSEYATLLRAVGWAIPDQGACERALAGTVLSVAAFEDDLLVGMGRLIGDGVENWVLVDLAVDPAYQGHGVGSALVAALEEEVVRAAPGSTLLLFCAARVAPFYERLGYEVSPGTFMKKALPGRPHALRHGDGGVGEQDGQVREREGSALR
jgi:GNAT superfamily N-acetyltransferase